MRLLLCLLAVPFIEIALFIQVGGLIGVWSTLGLVVLSAVVGAALMRRQGVEALRRLQAKVEAGQDPSGPMADGAMAVLSGLLLIVPGFFTDAIGLALLLPPVRTALLRRFVARARMRAAVRETSWRRGPAGAAVRRAETIEGDFEVLDDVPPSQRGASGWTRPMR